MQVTFKGSPIEVKGTQLQVGDTMPNVELENGQGERVQLHDILSGKVTILSIIPNVLTRTCELQTKRFDKETEEKGYQFLTLSRNTVEEFNQWNQDNGLSVSTLSDVHSDFGKEAGIEIELGDNSLLTRTVYVVKPDLTIDYVEYVSEVADEPNYGPALEAAAKLS